MKLELAPPGQTAPFPSEARASGSATQRFTKATNSSLRAIVQRGIPMSQPRPNRRRRQLAAFSTPMRPPACGGSFVRRPRPVCQETLTRPTPSMLPHGTKLQLSASFCRMPSHRRRSQQFSSPRPSEDGRGTPGAFPLDSHAGSRRARRVSSTSRAICADSSAGLANAISSRRRFTNATSTSSP